MILKMFFYKAFPCQLQHLLQNTSTSTHHNTSHNTKQHDATQNNATHHHTLHTPCMHAPHTTHTTQCSSDTLSPERQHHDLQQDQAHFIQSGAQSAKEHQDDVPDANLSLNREIGQGPCTLAVRCVAVASAACWMLDCLLACGVGVHGVVYVLVCVQSVCVCVCVCCVCVCVCVCSQCVFAMCVHGVCPQCVHGVCSRYVCVRGVCVDGHGCDSGVACGAQQNHCRTRHAIRKYITLSKNTSRFFPKATVEPLRATESHCRATPKPMSSHSEPLKASVEPLRATERSCSFFKFQVRGPQALPSSRVTGVRQFHVRG